jgi:hypothetical protein
MGRMIKIIMIENLKRKKSDETLFLNLFHIEFILDLISISSLDTKY